LATELLINMTQVDMVGIAYKSTGAALPDLLSGQIQLIVGSLLPTYPHLQTGKLRPLAVTTAKRWYSLPNVPTLGDTLPATRSSFGSA
jgi:tripartite-type tricarboxylate transporter receptor subunit TctC